MSIKTITERDAEIESLWTDFQIRSCQTGLDNEAIAKPFLHFRAGTALTTILTWFGECHSKGLEYLALSQSEREEWDLKHAEAQRREKLCCECDSETCCFNPEGICKYPILFGAAPILTEDGCSGWQLLDKDNLIHLDTPD